MSRTAVSRSTGSGNITIGTGGTGGGGFNAGIHANNEIAAVSGLITLNGRGGSSSRANSGILPYSTMAASLHHRQRLSFMTAVASDGVSPEFETNAAVTAGHAAMTGNITLNANM